jgi:5-methylthioribose kinase
VQAGNVLLARGGAKLLDAEIAHVGDPAFDVGTLLAHDWLAALHAGSVATATAERAARIWNGYRTSLGEDRPVAFADVARYAGLEMMRRTIGAARVRAVEGVETSLAAIEVAERLVREPPAEPAEVRLA